MMQVKQWLNGTCKVHRVLLADFGTLLICLLDANGALIRLQQDLRRAFSGCPPKQTIIACVSVMRLFTTLQLLPEDRQRLQAVCDQFTEKLQGLKFRVEDLW